MGVAEQTRGLRSSQFLSSTPTNGLDGLDELDGGAVARLLYGELKEFREFRKAPHP